MEFASKREFKKFTEAFTAFLARRETREIRRQAKNVDPNAGAGAPGLLHAAQYT